MTDVVVDCKGNPIKVGDRVRCGLDDSDIGIIVDISEPDGDVDDYGRGISVNPSVTVEFPKFQDLFYTYWSSTDLYVGDNDNTPWKCDDVELTAPFNPAILES